MSLSLRKMSGILMEIYCCLPKPYLLLTCHNVASAFFGRLESVEVIPLGDGSTGLWEGRSYPARQPKRNPWAKSGRPCSGKTPRTPRDPRLEGDVARFTRTGGTARPRRRQRSPWQGLLMK